MPSYNLSPLYNGWQGFNAAGQPLNLGTIEVYLAGTPTPTTTWTSSTAAVPNSNPIVLNNGFPPNQIWLQEGVPVKFVLKDSAGNLISTNDNVSSVVPTSGSFSVATTYPTDTVGAKLKQFSTFRDYGAIGDGSADDTPAVTAALASNRYWIDGEGLTYKITSTITATVAHKITNANFVGTAAIATDGAILRFSGSIGTAVLLTVNATANTFSATVASATTFSPYQWVKMASTASFSSLVGHRYGELIQIKSIAGNVITFYTPLGMTYTTAAAASIAPITMLDNVTIDNCNLTCSTGTDDGIALRFDYCNGLLVNNVVTKDADYVHIWIGTCANATVTGGRSERTGIYEGLDYGVSVVNGCYNVLVHGYTSVDVRHGCTLGGTLGASRWITFSHCHVSGAVNAGIDVHAGVIEHAFLYNTVSFSADVTASGDGVISQGAQCLMIGNQVLGGNRHGFFYQPDVSPTEILKSCVMRDNRGVTDNATAASSGIVCYAVSDLGGGAVISSIIMENNVGQGWAKLATVYAAGTNVIRAIISGNHMITSSSGRLIECRADTGLEISALEITGNVGTDVTGTEGIYVFGVGTGRAKNVRITSNRVNGGSTASLRLAACDNVVVDRTNQFSGGAVTYLVDAASTDVSIDLARSPIVTVSASDSYTVAAADMEIICNRAATVTLTLPTPAVWTDRELIIKTIQTQAVNSAGAPNVQPIADTTLTNSILPATDGAWARLRSDGTSWVTMCRGT
jgi:hypothetical protein